MIKCNIEGTSRGLEVPSLHMNNGEFSYTVRKYTDVKKNGETRCENKKIHQCPLEAVTTTKYLLFKISLGKQQNQTDMECSEGKILPTETWEAE